MDLDDLGSKPGRLFLMQTLSLVNVTIKQTILSASLNRFLSNINK